MFVKIKHFVARVLKKSETYAELDIRYVAKGGFWSSVMQSVSLLTTFALAVVFANFLPKETYGTYKYLWSLAGSLGFLNFSGIQNAVTRAVSQGYEGALRSGLNFQLKGNMLSGLGLAAGGTYYLLNGNLVFAAALFTLAVFLPVTFALNTYGAFLAGKKEFRLSAIYGSATSILYTLFIFGALFISRHLVVILGAAALANFLLALFFYVRTLAVFKPAASNAAHDRDLFRYGGHLSIINIVSGLAATIDSIVIFQFLGPDQLAIYAFSKAAPDQLKGFSKTLFQLALPKLSTHSINDISLFFYKRTFQGMALGTAMSAAYIIAAPFLFDIFLPVYRDAVFFSQVLSLSLIFIMAGSYAGSVFYAQRMVRTIYLSSVTSHLALIILYIVFGALWGLWGIIASVLTVHGGGTLLNILLWEAALRRNARPVPIAKE